jgi:hypothetical protein
MTMRTISASEIRRTLQRTYEGPGAEKTTRAGRSARSHVKHLAALALLALVITIGAWFMAAEVIPDVPGPIQQDLPQPVAHR